MNVKFGVAFGIELSIMLLFAGLQVFENESCSQKDKSGLREGGVSYHCYPRNQIAEGSRPPQRPQAPRDHQVAR